MISTNKSKLLIQTWTKTNTSVYYVVVAWFILVLLSFLKDYLLIVEFQEVYIPAITLFIRALLSWSAVFLFFWVVYRFSITHPIKEGAFKNIRMHLLIFTISIVVITAWFTLMHYWTQSENNPNYPIALSSLDTVYISYFRSLILTMPFLYVIVLLSQCFLELSRKKISEATNNIKNENESLRYKLSTLRAKINPHFLFNVLQGISSVSHNNKSASIRMLKSLNVLFSRLSIENEENTTVIAKEFSFIRNYLLLEKIRFKDRLSTIIKVEDGCKNKGIPNFILQPVIENSIKHVVAKSSSSTILCIECFQENNLFFLIVEDSGDSKKDYQAIIRRLNNGVFGFGLKNVKNRLLLYTLEASISFSRSKLGGLKTSISLPIFGD